MPIRNQGRITPSDIESIEFKRAVVGYDKDQVQELLGAAAHEIATLRGELQCLSTQASKPLSRTSKDVLLAAELDAKRIVADAHIEARSIIDDAKERCRVIEDVHQAKLSDLIWRIERTMVEKEKIVTTYKKFLVDQLDSIENSCSRYQSLVVVEGAYIEPDQAAQKYKKAIGA